MKETPIKKEIVDQLVSQLGIKDFAKATIREVKQVAAMSENRVAWSLSKCKWAFRACPRRSHGNGVTLYSSSQNEREASPTREGFLISLSIRVPLACPLTSVLAVFYFLIQY